MTSTTKLPLPTLLVLLAAGAMTSIVGSMVTPVFPEVVEALNVDPRWSGTLVSMHTLTLALFSPVFGLVADRIGKLKVLVPCLVLYTLFGGLGAFAQNYPTMLASRALVGAVSGGIAAASIGIVSTLFDDDTRSRILGFTTSALAVASIIFPIIGGWLGSFQWQYAFGLYLMGIPIAIAAAIILPEKQGKSAVQISASQRQELSASLRKPSILLLFLALALASATFYIVIVYAPLHFKETINASTTLNGIILACRAIGAAIIASVGAPKLARRFGLSGAIAIGFFLMASMLVMIPLLIEIPLILPTAILFGMGYGIVMPNLYDFLARLSSANLRTTILALGTGISSLGQFISPLFLGPVWKSADVMVFYLGGGIGLAIALTSLLLGQRWSQS